MIKKFIFLFTLLNIFVANAQWTTDTAVNTLISETSADYMETAATSTGGTYIAFWKKIDVVPVTHELWIQYLDEEGNKTLGSNGALISNTLPMVGYTNTMKISVDKMDNLYLGVTGTGTGTPCVIYKINQQGQILWQKDLGAGYIPSFLQAANGDVIVSYSPGTTKARMMRYDSEGNELWPAFVEVTPSAAYSNKITFTSNIFEHANGDFTVIFQVKTGYTPASLTFAQRYNSAGVPLWAESVQLANKGTVWTGKYSGAVDGDVVYYGYSLITDRFDAYLQRINPDGTLPWGINGVDFDTNETYFEKEARMAFEPSSHSIWMIANYTSSGQGMAGERVQKFDKETGARQFTDNAKEVYPIDEEARIHKGDLYLMNDKPLFVLKSGFDNSGNSPTTLSAVFLDENGNLATSILPVATFAGNKDEVTLNKPVNNYAVVAFNEYRNEDEIKYMYAQRFSTELSENCTIAAPVALADITSACALSAAELTAPTATDSCGVLVTATTSAVFPLTQGTTVVTWTFTSSTGATATATQNVIVNDTTAPVLVVKNITVEVGEDASVTFNGSQLDNGSTDECGSTAGWTWTVSPSGLSCIPGDKNISVTVTDLNGNSTTTNAIVTVTDPNNYCGVAGTDEFEQNKVVLYPNPTQDTFNITSPTVINNVVIYDMLGKTIYTTTASQNNITIDSKGWSAGVYNISIENANGAQQRLKLLKN